MMKWRFLYCLLIGAVPLSASVPRLRTMSEFADFSRGKTENIVILADGKLTLGSHGQQLLDTGDPFVWSIATDNSGNIYVGTGNDGRIYRIDSKGDTSIFFDSRELEVYALTCDRRGFLYAATSPLGRVYRIDQAGKATAFFSCREKYIWDLAWDTEQNLLVATGGEAAIFRVHADGRCDTLALFPETHVRCLAVDERGTIYAGTSGKGHLYRMEKGGPPFLLFDTQNEEILSLAVTSGGMIMAAASSEGDGMAAAAATVSMRSRSGEQAAASAETAPEQSLGTMSMVMENMPGAAAVTSLFRVDQNGFGKSVWNLPAEQIQTVVTGEHDQVLVGTGPRGRVYRVAGDGSASLLVSTEAGQVTTILRPAAQTTLLGTANAGLVWRYDARAATQGVYESEVIDAGLLSDWGVLKWQGQANGARVAFYTRTGNSADPTIAWSPWQPLSPDGAIGRIASPVARFLQYKCEMTAKDDRKPVVDEISVSYMQKNQAPEILAVMIYPQNEYYSPGELPVDTNEDKGLVSAQAMGKSEKRRGYRTAQWLFEDANFDGVAFDLFYRREQDREWRVLAQDWRSNIYPWDSSQMADGLYRLKVRVTDRPQVPQSQALSSDKESDPFHIDNTGPLLSFQPGAQPDQIVCTISDAASLIAALSYSLNVQGWQTIYPDDGMADSQQESVTITIPKELHGQVEIAVKASDAAGNYSSSFTTMKVKE